MPDLINDLPNCMESSKSPVLWSPTEEQIAEANLTRFASYVRERFELEAFDSYEALHRWSVDHSSEFWRCVWEFCGCVGSLGSVDATHDESILSWDWFPDTRLNFAEALLRPHELSDEQFASSLALVGWDERDVTREFTRKELCDEVIAFANYLRSRGIGKGDRVVAVIPNGVEAVIAMLGTTAVGAIWSSCSPEFGDDAIFDRFSQVSPKLLVTVYETTYGGKFVYPFEKVKRVLSRLETVESVCVAGASSADATISLEQKINLDHWHEVVRVDGSRWDFERYPFSHPLCIVYSSGTTGVPKCIVHCIGGALLQHSKEHKLHCDIRPRDVLFYYTTTGWMMWNWLVSALASKATVLVYDGSPVYPALDSIWKKTDRYGVTHFGASARYYAMLDKAGFDAKKSLSKDRLRCILSTGSPLLPETYDYLYRGIKPSFNLASISGGTDILSCFVLGNPTQPVRRGEIQCKGLGMDVQVLNESGEKQIGLPGELVCANAFPSMPIGFWNDPDGKKYRAAYFERFSNRWCHGDWAMETPEGAYWIYGRSDATLNPSGVRIGTAEIYQQVESFAEVAESLATVLKHDGDEQIVLFVRMCPGIAFTPELADAIRMRLRTRCSPRHAPAFISEAPDFPRTMSGKLSEIAVRNAICGQDLGNAGALANPESLAFFRQWKPTR